MTHSATPPTRFAPIAIVGIGCRLPGGVSDPSSALELLRPSADAVVDQPADRWSLELHHDPHGAPGRTQVRRGGFLHQDLTRFDPAFFGISPREAATLDPQQRLLLEVTWEAFEDAGLCAEALAGSPTGVFIGGFTLDAMLARFSASNQDAIDNHTATSSSMTLLSNRLSYTFDLRGPSLTVDTACSSSLVAVHLACEALHRGECTVAVAGGVNAILMPYYQVVMSKGHFLAPDGRSKTFEADADGYGRGEGAGVVVLKPLDRALADGDRIWGVIRGTGVNQDGATDGIPMPNPEAQRALIRSTCDRAGLSPQSVAYVEAHGTGTRAGDACESRAIGAEYGVGRAAPLAVGSIKANIGHLEAAAGVAGLIKATLAVHHRELFPHRPLRRPNPEIPFAALNLRVPQALEPWPSPGPARAAVNSFGYGGTNAHVLVEEPPRGARPAAPAPEGPALLPVSARSEAALRQTAAALAPLDAPLGDLAGALAQRRSAHPQRAAVVAADPAQARAALEALAAGTPHPALIEPRPSAPGVVWVFTGMGPQHWGMGQQLYAQHALAREAMDEVDALFRAQGGGSILEAMLRPEHQPRMRQNAVAQPANLVVQVGLAALLRAWGPAPAAILGHSVGEVAAAWAAGALSLQDAVTVAVHRARLQQRAAGQGGMLALGVGRAAAEELIGALPLVVAADNAPDLVTLAGPHDALEALSARAQERGLFARAVRVEVPYHSPAMDPLREELLQSLAGLRPQAPALPLYSTMSGARVEGPAHDGLYWWRNTRQAVLLADATRAALSEGHRLFLELGPHPVLGPSLQSTARAAGERIFTLPTLRRGEDEPTAVRAALGALWAHGLPLRWEVLAPEGSRVPLPRTPWQRVVCWAETPAARRARLGEDSHPLLRRREDGPHAAWVTRLAGPALAWVRDHVVDGAVVLPGAATLEAFTQLALQLGEAPVLDEVRFEQALVLPEGAAVDLRVAEAEPGRLRAHGRVGEAGWTQQASATLRRGARWAAPAPRDLGALRARLCGPEAEELPVEGLYAALEARGLRYGPAFRGVRRLWRRGSELLAELALPTSSAAAGWRMHPALLDAALQCLVALAPPEAEGTVLPVGARRVRSHAALGDAAILHLSIDSVDGKAIIAQLLLMDDAGAVLAELQGMRCELVLTQAPARRWVHATAWQPVELPAGALPAAVAVRGEGSLAAALRGALGPRLDEAAPCRVLALEPAPEDPVGVALTTRALAELQAALREGVSQLWLLTQRAVAVRPGEPVHPAAAALGGLLRVAQNEHPELHPRGLDLDTPDAAAVLAALAAQSPEEEQAWRAADGFFARRIQAVDVDALPAPRPPRALPLGVCPVALELGQPGRLDSLVFRAVPRPAPGPGEVELEVDAASLNFKDLMKAMGMLADVSLENAYLGRGLGLEAAGRVLRVGPGVEGLAPGDPVFTYCGGALRSHLVVDQRFVVRRPEGMGPVEGSSLFVFLTAWYALVHAGRLQAGESVLIHSAAGGVGLAAVQIAQHLGARVLATAGTADKRALLAQLGVEHVYDSRTLDFADAVRADTGGVGVDVVLNSLAGAALQESLALVAPGGRFLELGKQDMARDAALGMRPFNRSIAFIAIDLDRMATERPGWFAPAAREVMAAFAEGQLRALPTRVFPASQAEDAFRLLASGELAGKVVLDLRQGEARVHAPRARPLAGGRPWLVAGGLGGFGLRAALWLAQRGVSELVLASRRGAPAPEDAATWQALRATGAQVRTLALDLTDAAAVEAAVAGLPALGGVLHAAMVLADAPLAELGPEAVALAMGAKAQGAWNLHQACRGRDLDHFLLFGSISAQVGNPGQAAYAAANAALEGLALHRAAQGLPAACVSWGALGEVGVVAREHGVRAHLRSLGLEPLPPRAALQALEAALLGQSPAFTLVDIRWDTWARQVPGVGWRRLEGLLETAAAGEDPGLRALPPEARREAVLRQVREAAAAVFRMAPEAIAEDRSLRDQGLDSILAVELGLHLRSRLGVELSAMDLLAGRGVGALAEALLGRLGLEEAPPAPAPAPAPTPREDLEARICVTRPYYALEDLALGDDALSATVVPDTLPGEASAVAAGEVGRHLAILGSLAVARAWPQPGRHAYPVASSTLELEPGAPAAPGTRFTLEARCVAVDLQRGRAEAQGVMRTLDGGVVGRLRVGYHVLPYAGFERLFAEHRRPTAEARYLGTGALPSPYAAEPARPAARWDGAELERVLPPIAVEDCAGHFAGLPALPVSILGRHVLAAVLDAAQAAGLPSTGLRLARADLLTERFAWAGERLCVRARPVGGARWACEVSVHGQGDRIASFALELAGVPTRPAQARRPAVAQEAVG